MGETVAVLWSAFLLFIATLLGMGVALFGVDQIAASAAVHLGGYRAAQASSPLYGQHITGQISANLSGPDLNQVGSSAWSEDAAGRTVSGEIAYQPNVGWMTHINLRVKTGTQGRIEDFFPDRPHKFE